MKKLISILLFLAASRAFATNYFVSLEGSDAAAGTTTGTAWKTIGKVNSMMGSMSSGDFISFLRGETYYGSINIIKNGVTINAYGTGAKPIISGFTSVTGWTNLGSNIWESTTPVSTLAALNMVSVNGVNTAMGRSPNTGYYTYQSHSGTGGNITSSDLSGSPNWTGAELALTISTYTIGRNPITAQSGGTLTYTRNAVDEDIQSNGQKFIIQNDARTLDAQNEWYFNPGTGKVRFYSTSTPANVQISTIDTLVKIINHNYVTIDNIKFIGSNISSVCIANSTNILIQNSDFDYGGRDGIFGPFSGNSTNCRVQFCTFNNSNNNAVDISGGFDNAVISSNVIKSCGRIYGMGSNGAAIGGGFENGLTNYSGILTGGVGTLIEYNTIDSVAYNEIRFFGSNSEVKNNYLTNSNLYLTDGGAIYTDNDGSAATGLKIHDNILINGSDNGIYCDAQTTGVEIYNNTIANFGRAALFINNDNNINVHNNTVYNSTYCLWVDNLAYTLTNVNIQSNIFFAKTSTQKTALYNLSGSTVPATLTADSNYYARPVDDNLSLLTYLSGTYTDQSLTNWKALSGKDVHSNKSPRSVPSVDSLRFEYNETGSPKIISLPYKYMNVKGVQYNGTITLDPYKSEALIYSGPISGGGNTPPVARAGADQSFALPTNSTSLSGSASTDADGTIVFYAWSIIGGGGSLSAPYSVNTLISSLPAGVNTVRLTVTDNLGATSTDDMVITVAAGNIPPVANAGPDQTVPTTTTTINLSGSGTDADGTVSSYYWTKSSGGSGVITTPSSATTTVTGLVPGTYQFTLLVTDNNGANSTDAVLVVVQDGVINFYINKRGVILKPQ